MNAKFPPYRPYAAVPRRGREVRGPVCCPSPRAPPAQCAPLAAGVLEGLCDSHSHIHRSGAAAVASAKLPCRVVVLGTSPDDWGEVTHACEALGAGRGVAGFGVHPWFVEGLGTPNDNANGTWISALRKALQRDAASIVGEIGLDKVRGKQTMGWQKDVFRAQLALAGELQRPVSVHCVRAHGDLYDMLRTMPPASLPPRIALHSYTGSPDITKSLLALPCGDRLFFGISASVNGKTSAKLPGLLAVIPTNRLLLETDTDEAGSVCDLLSAVVRLVGESGGWSVQDVVQMAKESTAQFFS